MWTEVSAALIAKTHAVSETTEFVAIRMVFQPVSNAMIRLAEKNRPDGINKCFCPMALGHGAYWLAKGDAVLNPYYGAQRLPCGAKQKF